MRIGWQVLLWQELCVSSVCAKELSADVYPSEEELEQALTNQEIDIVQFLELRELLRYDIDSTHQYLIAAITADNLNEPKPFEVSVAYP